MTNTLFTLICIVGEAMPSKEDNSINYICKYYSSIRDSEDDLLSSLCKALRKLRLNGFSEEVEVIEYFINIILEYLLVIMQYEKQVEYAYIGIPPFM